MTVARYTGDPGTAWLLLVTALDRTRLWYQPGDRASDIDLVYYNCLI